MIMLLSGRFIFANILRHLNFSILLFLNALVDYLARSILFKLSSVVKKLYDEYTYLFNLRVSRELLLLYVYHQ
jgi:hypothetical protein